MEVWLKGISKEFLHQLQKEPLKCLGSATVLLSFLQQLTPVSMDTMPIDLLGKLLNTVIQTDAKNGKQHLEVLIQDEKSRFKVTN